MYSMVMFYKLNSCAPDAICTAACSAITKTHPGNDHVVGKNKRSGQNWYAGLSDKRKAEHLKKQRLNRLQKKAASVPINVKEGESATPKELLCKKKFRVNNDHETSDSLLIR